MWKDKILDITRAPDKLQTAVMGKIKKHKLSPLEFTILQTIFNNKQVSVYDIIEKLNEHYAGTWNARKPTVFPILSKLKRAGFLELKKVKIRGFPIIKVYRLTEEGEKVITTQISKNFEEQVQFIRNTLIELIKTYVNSHEGEQKKATHNSVEKLMKDLLQEVVESIPSDVDIDT
ncbi:MAG: PadR family transcriptional regulator [Candidatus Hodarchaeota archaeon]